MFIRYIDEWRQTFVPTYAEGVRLGGGVSDPHAEWHQGGRGEVARRPAQCMHYYVPSKYTNVIKPVYTNNYCQFLVCMCSPFGSL